MGEMGETGNIATDRGDREIGWYKRERESDTRETGGDWLRQGETRETEISARDWRQSRQRTYKKEDILIGDPLVPFETTITRLLL